MLNTHGSLARNYCILISLDTSIIIGLEIGSSLESHLSFKMFTKCHSISEILNLNLTTSIVIVLSHYEMFLSINVCGLKRLKKKKNMD